MHLRGLVASHLVAGAVAVNIPRDLSIRQNTNTSAHTIELHATLYGARFHAPTTIGGETFNLLVDTGSSDTFVIEDNFECYGINSLSGNLMSVDQSICGYADAAYEINESNTFERITGEAFQVEYAAGIARGLMAFEDIALGDVTVTDQRFGLVNWSTPMNFGASGVLGLAYPIITSAYEINGTLDTTNLTAQGEPQPYNPLFVSMYRRGLVEPYFSLALNRLPSDQESGDGGYMVLGGLPDVELSSNWTTVPAEYYDAADILSQNGTRLRSYWATTVQGLTYGSDGEYSNSYQTVVDSGAPMSSVPGTVAREFNSLFDPPGQWNEIQQGYIVDCDATAPDFAVRIGDATFTANPLDMILHTGQTYNGDDMCLSAIGPGLEMGVDPSDPTNTTELYLLGAGFMKSVVSVFDFGNSEMRFAARQDESSAVSLVGGLGSGRLIVFGVMVAVFHGVF
ncbi:aspartic peptidase domain-containing protein [Aspergillus cavernicola]|uniref:Aspartic peptidase domain-containing protein n=1 Tax=Aspergillus cavernicola TaxID=176166 RepID=A0ABR4HL32_9EURO